MMPGMIYAMIIGVGSAIVGAHFGIPIYISVIVTVMLIAVGNMRG